MLRLIPNMTNSTINIAQAMLHATFADEGSMTFRSKDINELAGRYARALEGLKA